MVLGSTVALFFLLVSAFDSGIIPVLGLTGGFEYHRKLRQILNAALNHPVTRI